MRGRQGRRGGLAGQIAWKFPSEVLGLVKAQMVKNAVIVPLWAKGGFRRDTIEKDASREESAS